MFKNKARHWTQASGIKRDGQFRCKAERIAFEDAHAKDPGSTYEQLRLPYTIQKDYIADIVLSNGILVEVKGWFQAEDRSKMLLVKQAHPDMDIRFLFARANAKLYKSSNTTIGAWATKNGFKWAEGKTIPPEWFKEDGYAPLKNVGASNDAVQSSNN